MFLEANYEPDVLKCSRYPYPLKQRIGGELGHLSNPDAGKIIAYLLTAGVDNVMLGHLSQENNFPELAYKAVMNEVMNSHASDKSFSLQVANRHTCSKWITLE